MKRYLAASSIFIAAAALTGFTASTVVQTPAKAAVAKKSMNPLLKALIAETKDKSVHTDTSRQWPHRGIFHQSESRSLTPYASLAENSLAAVSRAKDFSPVDSAAVEIDVRLSSDNVAIVIHDHGTNRSTTLDNASGKYNPYWSIKKGLTPPTAIADTSKTAAQLTAAQTKRYRAGSEMRVTGQYVLTLKNFLQSLPDGSPLIILDLQAPAVVAAAAKAVQETGMQDRVVLKIFANSAVPNPTVSSEGELPAAFSKVISDWGNDLWYVIQFNNGQFVTRSGVSKISHFGFDFTPINYMNRWLNTGRMVGIAMSKPDDNTDAPASFAVDTLATYFEAAGTAIPTIGIIINPDSSWVDNAGTCTLYRFNGGGVGASPFTYSNQTQKRDFAYNLDYAIADVMPYTYTKFGSVPVNGINPGEAGFTSTLCNSSLRSEIIAQPQ